MLRSRQNYWKTNTYLNSFNPENESIRTQATSQDLLPPIGTSFALLQVRGEESRWLVMKPKPEVVPNRSALINNNFGNTVQNTGYGGYNGARGHGRGNSHGGGRMGFQVC